MTQIPDAAVNIDSDIFATSLAQARITDLDDFRSRELEWLEENSFFAHVAITGFFAKEMKKENTETAKAGMLGCVLGSYVIRQTAETSMLDYDDVAANHRSNFTGSRLIFTHEVDIEELTRIFGRENAAVFAEIRDPVSRTMCSAFMLTSLLDNQNIGSPDFLLFQPLPQKPKRPERSFRGGQNGPRQAR